jgi:hypothetical protein
MLGRVTLVRTDVSEELSASIIRETTIGELRTTLAVTCNQQKSDFVFLRSVRRLLVTAIVVTLMMELSSSEMLLLTRATRPNIPEDGVFHSHCRENLKSYIALTGWTL